MCKEESLRGPQDHGRIAHSKILKGLVVASTTIDLTIERKREISERRTAGLDDQLRECDVNQPIGHDHGSEGDASHPE